MKVVILLAVLAVAAAHPEAPLSPRYGPPSAKYGPPSQRNGPNGNGPPQDQQLDTEAIFPNQNGGAPAPQYGAPVPQYGAPAPQYGAPAPQYGAPAPQYGAPAPQYGAPAPQYGAPAPQYGPPSAKYGPPGYQSAAPISTATEDPLAEPASYKFEYKVEDEEAGLDFGHQEEREGDDSKGEYKVLLPDGRTMIVTYTADQDGYKPEIKFEEARGGYPKGAQNGY